MCHKEARVVGQQPRSVAAWAMVELRDGAVQHAVWLSICMSLQTALFQ